MGLEATGSQKIFDLSADSIFLYMPVAEILELCLFVVPNFYKIGKINILKAYFKQSMFFTYTKT